MKKENCRSVIQPEFDERKGRRGYEVHHVFQGINRRRCELYGFLVAIPREVHQNAHRNTNTGIALIWKQDCQRWYEKNQGTREDFIREFGRNYL